MNLKLTLLDGVYAVSKLHPSADIPPWATGSKVFSITRTPEELSIVTLQEAVPQSTHASGGWRMFKVHGPIDFSEVGVLNSLTSPLANSGISIFAISTFDTDYLLIKNETVARAIEVLRLAGHDLS